VNNTGVNGSSVHSTGVNASVNSTGVNGAGVSSAGMDGGGVNAPSVNGAGVNGTGANGCCVSAGGCGGGPGRSLLGVAVAASVEGAGALAGEAGLAGQGEEEGGVTTGRMVPPTASAASTPSHADGGRSGGEACRAADVFIGESPSLPPGAALASTGSVVPQSGPALPALSLSPSRPRSPPPPPPAPMGLLAPLFIPPPSPEDAPPHPKLEGMAGGRGHGTGVGMGGDVGDDGMGDGVGDGMSGCVGDIRPHSNGIEAQAPAADPEILTPSIPDFPFSNPEVVPCSISERASPRKPGLGSPSHRDVSSHHETARFSKAGLQLLKATADEVRHCYLTDENKTSPPLDRSTGMPGLRMGWGKGQVELAQGLVLGADRKRRRPPAPTCFVVGAIPSGAGPSASYFLPLSPSPQL
jgi:hypothetical protein